MDIRSQAEQELVSDLGMKVVYQGDGGDGTKRYQLQNFDNNGKVRAVRPTEQPMFTLWSEAIRGREALLKLYQSEQQNKQLEDEQQ
jgi:hypothetical protein